MSTVTASECKVMGSDVYLTSASIDVLKQNILHFNRIKTNTE